MFATLGQFVVKVVNLAEAEGRVAMSHLLRLAMVIVLFASVGVLVTAAAVLLAAAIYVALASVLHPATALLVSALFLLCAAAVIGFIARSLWLRRHSRNLRRTARHES